MIQAAIHGFVLALGLILPLGVQNVFVINQGATQPRFIKALPVVITASICDSFLILMAIMGVSAIVLGIPWLEGLILGIGIIFLIYMGISTWTSKAESTAQPIKVFSAKKQILFAASVSLLNPHAIMDTVGVIGTSSLSYHGFEKVFFTVSCIVVSWIWFFVLAILGQQSGKLDKTGRFLVWLNKSSAFIMWGTAVYLAYSLVK